jgi:hypothetical protein
VTGCRLPGAMPRGRWRADGVAARCGAVRSWARRPRRASTWSSSSSAWAGRPRSASRNAIVSRAAAAVGAAPASSAQRRLRCRWARARSRAPRCRSACPQACSATAGPPRRPACAPDAPSRTPAPRPPRATHPANRSASRAASRHDGRCTPPSPSREGCGVNEDSALRISRYAGHSSSQGSCAGADTEVGRMAADERECQIVVATEHLDLVGRELGAGMAVAGRTRARAHARDAGGRGRDGARARRSPGRRGRRPEPDVDGDLDRVLTELRLLSAAATPAGCRRSARTAR